jgi:hypothetical protein
MWVRRVRYDQEIARPPAPGPLEDYAAHFDDLFNSLAKRQAFRC